MMSRRNTVESRPRRSLTARSVLASTLLGVSPPELPTRALVSTAELLGIATGTTRVAISRMVAAGELAATDGGYRLIAPELLARQTRQDLSRRGVSGPWDGAWRTAIVVRDDRTPSERTALRGALTSLRFAELREGSWIRPANLPSGVLTEAEVVAAAQCAFVTGALELARENLATETLATENPEPLNDQRALAAHLWDLTGWADRAVAVLADLDRLGPLLEDHDHRALAEGFLVSADALRHLQADPLLPADLLPTGWPGDRLRDTHRRYDEAFKTTLAHWQRTHS